MKLESKTYSEMCKALKIEDAKSGKDKIVIDRSVFDSFVKEALKNTGINEQAYQSLYPDVKQWVSQNAGATAQEHFVQTGFFEDRFLIPADFDEKKYLRANPDIAVAVKKGQFETGLKHYILFGHEQKRPLH